MVDSGELKLTDIPFQYRSNLDNCFVSVRWNGMSKYIKKGRLDNYENDMFIKKLTREYNKGTITESGRVIPFMLPEDFEVKGVTNAKKDICNM